MNHYTWMNEFGRDFQVPAEILGLIDAYVLADVSDGKCQDGACFLLFGYNESIALYVQDRNPDRRKRPDRCRFTVLHQPSGRILLETDDPALAREWLLLHRPLGIELMVDAVKLDILLLTREKIIPCSRISRFADLHNYVDANMLGSETEVLERACGFVTAATDKLNAVQERVDAWIRDGTYRKLAEQEEKHPHF